MAPTPTTFLQGLIDRGASVHVRDNQGRTVLHQSAQLNHPKFYFFLGLGLDIHAVDLFGNNLLHEIAQMALL
jgi:hypothetical protein